MTTTSDAKRITYNRTTKDYDATFDGRYIGSFANHHQAEVALNDYALDLIEQGLVDDMQVLARPAEAVELLHSDDPPNDGQEPGGSGGGGGTCRMNVLGTRWTVCGADSDGPCYCDTFVRALPAAPPAVETIVRTPDTFSGLDGSTAAGREGAAPDEETCESCGGRPGGCYDCEPTWAKKFVAPMFADLDPPMSGFFQSCTVCGGPHVPTRCPEVALAKYGMGVWEAYMEDRAAFLKLVQWAAAPRLALMGDAVAFYLSARWGHAITGYQVLASWQQNAARA